MTLAPSPQDRVFGNEIRNTLALGDISTTEMIIGGTKFSIVKPTGHEEFKILPALRKERVPVVERKKLVGRGELLKRTPISGPDDARAVMEQYSKGQDGALFLARDNRPIVFLPFKSGVYSHKTLSAKIVGAAEKFNSSALILHYKTKTPSNETYFSSLFRGGISDIRVLDVIEAGKTMSWTRKGDPPTDYWAISRPTIFEETVGTYGKETLDTKTGDLSKIALNKIKDETGSIHPFGPRKGVEPLDKPIKHKDLTPVLHWFQFAYDVAKSHPEFKPLWEAELRYFENYHRWERHAYDTSKRYFRLSKAERQNVDEVLVKLDKKGREGYTIVTEKGKTRYNISGFKKEGLTQNEAMAALGVRKALNDFLELIKVEMEASGLPEEKIAQFTKNHVGYVPHKWYGKWAVVVKAPKTPFKTKAAAKGQATRYRNLTGAEYRPVVVKGGYGLADAEGNVFYRKVSDKTVHMEATDEWNLAEEEIAPRLRKLFPEHKVFAIKRTKLPHDLFVDVTPPQITQVLQEAVNKADVRPDVLDSLKSALDDIYKSKGFGAHMIRRRNVAGYTEDLSRPLAEYFGGASRWLAKIQKVREFAKHADKINPRKTPILDQFSRDWMRYNLTIQNTPITNAVKEILFAKFLWLNIKSAFVNMSGMPTTSRPRLGSKEVAPIRKSMEARFPGVQLTRATTRAAWDALDTTVKKQLARLKGAYHDVAFEKLTPADKRAFEWADKRGYFGAQYTNEMLSTQGGPFGRMLVGKVRRSFKLFMGPTEELIRRGTYLAFLRAGRKFHPNLKGEQLYRWATNHVGETQGFYMKGNRPIVMRPGQGLGTIASPFMTFKGWTFNYTFHYLKNTLKAGDYLQALRSMQALLFMGGLRALPFMGFAYLIYQWLTNGRDLETDVREGLGGGRAGRIVTRGVPADVVDIDFSGSVGLGDVVPTSIDDIPGAATALYEWIPGFGRDMVSGDFVRAFEDFVGTPEWMRNPMVGLRGWDEGLTTRGGTPIMDPVTGEQQRLTGAQAARKAFGFQPTVSSERYKRYDVVRRAQERQRNAQSAFVGKLTLAESNENWKRVDRIWDQIDRYNERHEKRPEILVNPRSIKNAVKRRLMGTKLSKRSQQHAERIYKTYGGGE